MFYNECINDERGDKIMDYFDYMSMDDFDNEYPFEEQLYYEEVVLGQKKTPVERIQSTDITKIVA